MNNFFSVSERDSGSKAKKGKLITEHGEIITPVFMPVGTQGAVKGMLHKEMNAIGTQIILNNLYHITLRPGIERIVRAGGIHKFIGWDKPILTDSGGFQILSLSNLVKTDDKGVKFKSHLDGKEFLFTPESVVKSQADIGVDIMMPLDYLIEYPATHEKAERALDITLEWEKRAIDYYSKIKPKGVLFGITQGSVFKDLRIKSTEKLLEMGFEGIAIGGLSVGETKQEMFDIIKLTREIVPDDIPVYLMGVGKPEDIIRAVELGVDMFDCVLPTRNARTGWLYTHEGKIIIKNSKYSEDFSPLDSKCQCYTCKNFSRAYLRHLYVAREINYSILSTFHNLFFYLDIMRKIRQSIGLKTFNKFKEEFFKKYKES
jgi:queuine tRNA-ribosyltransferase